MRARRTRAGSGWFRRLPVCASALLLAAACAPEYTPGPLGAVEVGPGGAVQIRMFLSPEEGGSGVTNQRIVRLALDHYGPVRGFEVSLGGGNVDDDCTPEGGRSGAQAIIDEEGVIGVIGTTCSAAAVEASSLLTAEGMVMISSTNTSPTLTSDLAGSPSEYRSEGYYRTSDNDLLQGAAVARYLYQEKGVTRAAAAHNGDVYTESLAGAFADSFRELGGEITWFGAVDGSQEVMLPALAEMAAGSPQALYFPVSRANAVGFVRGKLETVGLEDMLMFTSDALLEDIFMEMEETEGVFFSGPDNRFRNNENQSTGMHAAEILAEYRAAYGHDPETPFWAHTYDAVTLLLDAIEAASFTEGGALAVDRSGVREHLDGVSGYGGIIGSITCDEFGDCGVGKLVIVEHIDSGDLAASKANVVYEFGA